MKQIGNLAIICAMRKDVLFQLLNQNVTVFVGSGPAKAALTARWDDDEKINEMIRELNFGKFKQ